MLDFDILKAHGTTDQRLREILTARMPEQSVEGITEDERARITKDIETRNFIEATIRNRANEGISRSVKNYAHFQACDLAWDSTPIQKNLYPLLRWAQGKVGTETVQKTLTQLPDSQKFVKGQGGEVSFDLPAFVEVNVNLIRSFIMRRQAAQSAKFRNLWPYYFYDARGTSLEDKLCADVTSQRMDIMADDEGFREHDDQCVRDMFLYGRVLDVVRSAWEIDKTYRKKANVDLLDQNAAQLKDKLDVVIEREGVCFLNPHPTKWFYDNSSPITSINADNGCQFLGFWDIQRWRDIMGNKRYFNLDGLQSSTGIWTLFQNASQYVDYYCTVRPIPLPTVDPATSPARPDPAAQNDREANIGIYAADRGDLPIVLTNYYEKIVPADYGIGTYPYPVWVRYVWANDTRVVFAEIMPSRPASVLLFNQNDKRELSPSFAHNLMCYQDAMNNLSNALISVIMVEIAKFIVINKDAVPPEVMAAFRTKMQGKDWATTPTVVEVSFSEKAELGIDATKVLHIAETRQTQQTIESILKSMAALVQMVERLEAMSPAELGQPAPREISATEVSEISATTSAVYGFISDGIDSWREAKKRICFESWVACGEGPVDVPVLRRYPQEVIQRTKFELLGETQYGQTYRIKPEHVGNYNLIFSSRDGAERPQNPKTAQTLVQLLQVLFAYPPILQKIKPSKILEMVDEIFRMSGVKIDLELPIGEKDELSLTPEQLEQYQQMLAAAGQQIEGQQPPAQPGQPPNIQQGQPLPPPSVVSQAAA